MDKYIRIMYVEKDEMKKVLKKVDSAEQAYEEIDVILARSLSVPITITEFSFYHN